MLIVTLRENLLDVPFVNRKKKINLEQKSYFCLYSSTIEISLSFVLIQRQRKEKRYVINLQHPINKEALSCYSNQEVFYEFLSLSQIK